GPGGLGPGRSRSRDRRTASPRRDVPRSPSRIDVTPYARKNSSDKAQYCIRPTLIEWCFTLFNVGQYQFIECRDRLGLLGWCHHPPTPVKPCLNYTYGTGKRFHVERRC